MKTEGIQSVDRWIMLGLFALAWSIRVIGVDHGAVLGDERINEAAKVLAGQLVPDQHFYPPTLNYITAVLYGAMFAVGKFLGVWADTAAFRAQYFSDPEIFNIAGRVLVASFGALAVPIAYAFGRQLSYDRLQSLILSGLILLLPISVYLSYIFKGDVPLATFSLLSVYFLVRKVQEPLSARLDVYLAMSLVLALSFKHSFVFLMLPLAVAYLVLLGPRVGFVQTGRSVGRILLTTVFLWPILNIGIVLDFQSFLAFQNIQSVMSLTQGGSFAEAIGMLWQRMIHWQAGLGPVLPFAFLSFPLLALGTRQPRALLLIWLAVVVGMALVAYLVRLRQPEHLWVSFFLLAAFFAGLTLLELVKLLKSVGAFATSLSLGLALVGCIGVWQQTLAPSMTANIARLIQREYSDRKIVTSLPLPEVAQSKSAQDYELARVRRTADKYQVVLPPLSDERIVPLFDPAGSQTRLFIVPMPVPMSGLENANDDDLVGNIQAYAWPPQIEDWTLNNWLADGVDMFVVPNLSFLTGQTSSQMLRAFYQDLETRCTIVATFAPRKPLFLERETVVLDCA